MRGIIFDLDGVLVHTDKYHFQAWKQIALKKDIYFDETINNRLRGVSRMNSLEIILERYKGPALSQKEKEELAQEKNTIYRTLLNQLSPSDVSSHVRETLEALRKRGYVLSVGSSSKNAGFILKQAALEGYFDAVSDGNNITHSKPDPEVFLKAAEFMNVPPIECAVVEDARAGIDAAKSGGMTGIAMGDASGYQRADYSIKEFSELLNIFTCAD